MIPSEAAQLLAYMQAYDHRTVGEADVSVWATALADVRYADAEVAMHAHYRDSSDWLDPNRMRRLVKALRNDRLERTPMPCPPYELANDPVGTIEWLNDWRQRIADGETPDAIEGTRRMPAIESAFPRMPIADAVTEAAKAREALRLARVAKAAEQTHVKGDQAPDGGCETCDECDHDAGHDGAHDCDHAEGAA